MDKNKKQVVKISIFITSLFVIFLSATYAFINMTVTGTKRQVITSGNLQIELEEDNAITLTNAMPMYDDVGMIQDAFDFRVVNKLDVDAYYTLKLIDITSSSKEKLDTSIVKYGLTKDGVAIIDLLSNLKANQLDSGKINGNAIIHYSLRLWIDSTVESNATIQDKMLSYRVDLEVSNGINEVNETSILGESAFLNLGNACKTYEEEGTMYLVGQCANNYLWYSGKLWRITSKDLDTGTVKIVTDNSITSMPLSSASNFSFENSYADEWLQQEFLPTLHNYHDYLVENSSWRLTSATDVEGTINDSVERTVGLLTAWEYDTVISNSDGLANDENSYLNNKTTWWTLTPTDALRFYNVIETGELDYLVLSNSSGIRPAVNLKPGIESQKGTGTISDPYRIADDSKEIINGQTLLSTRHSGEYVKFNSELYRIVQKENQLTKITAVDVPSELLNLSFHNVENFSDFKSADMKNYLENYYQSLNQNFREMIEPNTTWYLGTVGSGTNQI